MAYLLFHNNLLLMLFLFFSATLQLEDCENVNEVVINLTRSCDVTVVSSNTLLCIAHLQSDFTDQQLQHLVSSYGKVARCFMYRCPYTGKNRYVFITGILTKVKQKLEQMIKVF